MNHYKDTYFRLRNDPEFRAIVEHLAKAAEEHGFTPGELRQMAFAAACLVEERNPKIPLAPFRH